MPIFFRRLLLMSLLSASLMFSSTKTMAAEEQETVIERMHSDLPLYTFDWDQLWPRSFTDADSFGCSSRVPFGDWQFTPSKSDENAEGSWYRFANYGVFHCAAVIQSAGERAELAGVASRHGFFVQLGRSRVQSSDWDLWALQVGIIPGSDYTLLARPSGRPGRIEDFVVLQQRCPSGMIRQTKGMDIFSTRYCAINSRGALLGLSRRMLRYPAVGTIRLMSQAD